MEYTNENCICIGEAIEHLYGKHRAFYCPIDGAFFWTFGDVEAGYEKVFGESAEEVVAKMKLYCKRRNEQLLCVLEMDNISL